MARTVIHSLGLCAGVGMLDEGARLAFEHLGFDFRPVAYVEWEAYAAQQLVTLMEAQCLDAAPVWCGDLGRLDLAPFRGMVDCITAGFPCQPHSVAGKRAGLDDERWIWPDIARIVGDVRPQFVLLENVPGLITSGGLDACFGDLAALGYDAEWALLSASAVGASHERERLFIFAWLAYAGHEHEHIQQRDFRPEHPRSDSELGHATSDGRRQGRTELRGQPRRSDPARTSGKVGDTDCSRRTPTERGLVQHAGREPEPRSGDVADSLRERRQQIAGSAHGDEGAHEGRAAQHHHEPERAEQDMGIAESQRLQGGGRGSDEEGRQEPHGYAELAGGALFAPGPSDERWPAILARWPFLAPALESGVRGVANGLALVVDESRSHQLRAIGNGVVPLQAAAAFVQLARRAEIMKQRDLFERPAA